ncbi:DUF4339 domain-containing protein [Flavobacterium chungnamense]|jgi:hypothetical protein|uniref:GYF domain-containing protein n=1 Tax=Flavobacterium chungnamense TaxID=706182 RepID=A0ABP7UJX1_9FLAO
MKKYFIHNGETENGPFNIEELATMQIKGDTPIWYEGLSNWTTASNVEELKSIIASNALPPKFDNFANQNTSIHPPNFNKTNTESQVVDESKKSKTIRNVVIGLSVLLLAIIAFSFMTSQPSSAEIELSTIKSDSIIKEDKRASINAAITEKNKKYRNNWSDYISVATNDFTYYNIGGIENLQIIATNKTEYKIDEINVTVCYEIDSGECYKTEEITIYNIPPNSQKSENAPNSSRGKNVLVNIVGIYCDKMNFGYAPGNWANNSDDPYFTNVKQ